MSDFSKRASRLPAGHPEGFYEAYANMYHSFCEKLLDRMNGCLKEERYYYFPHAFDGLAGVKYVQAAVDSQRKETYGLLLMMRQNVFVMKKG